MTLLVPLNTSDILEDFIQTTTAPYIAASDGIFLKRNTHLGTALIKQTYLPDGLGKVGYKDGVFFRKENPVPAVLFAQIVDFFKRIYDKHGTEAEVILTLNYETNEWRAFIPTQRVSGVSVNSVFNPEHIARKHLVIGTMHSHCNMGAFHSSTDVSDASDMDGIHFTIGRLGTEKPEIAVMVMINKIQFNYKPEEVADLSEIGQHKAPDWWDNYVQVPGKTPVGADLFAKFEPVKRIEPPKTTPKTTQTPSKWVPSTVYDIRGYIGRDDWDYGKFSDDLWDRYWDSQQDKIKKKNTKETTWEEDSKAIERVLNSTNPLLALLLDSDLLDDDDIMQLTEDTTIIGCRTLLLKKLNKVVTVLEDFGIEVRYKLGTVKENGKSNRNLVGS